MYFVLRYLVILFADEVLLILRMSNRCGYGAIGCAWGNKRGAVT